MADFDAALAVGAGQSVSVSFAGTETSEWIRVTGNRATTATVNFNYSDASRFQKTADGMFNGLTTIDKTADTGGLLYGLGKLLIGESVFFGRRPIEVFSNG